MSCMDKVDQLCIGLKDSGFCEVGRIFRSALRPTATEPCSLFHQAAEYRGLDIYIYIVTGSP